MPEFANPFSGLAREKKLTHEELVRAIRTMVAAEYEAVQLYMQLVKILTKHNFILPTRYPSGQLLF